MQSDAIRARALRSAHRRKAIRGTPRHSKAISGNQRAIREQSESNQRHSEALQGPSVEGTFGHQPSSAVISRHQWKVPSVSAQAQSSRIRRGIQPQAHNCRIEASTRGAPVRPTHLPPGAIRGNQRQSEAIRGNQWSPRTTDTPAIGRNQRQSEALRGTQRHPNMGSCLLWNRSAHATYQAANASDGLPNMDSCLIWQQPSSGATTGLARRSSASSRQHR